MKQIILGTAGHIDHGKTSLIKAVTGTDSDEGQPATDLLSMEGMDDELAYALARRGIASMEELAEQSVDDLMEIDVAHDLETSRDAYLGVIQRKTASLFASCGRLPRPTLQRWPCRSPAPIQ